MDTVRVDLDHHGTYSAPGFCVDAMIAKHLPNSPLGLRAIVEERSGLDYSDVTDVTAFLVILADWYQAELMNGNDRRDPDYERMTRSHLPAVVTTGEV